jgi:hypothetical protein
MKRFYLPVLSWALAMSHLFAQNQLPLSIQDYAVNWSFSVKQMLEAGGYEVPGPHAEFALVPEIKIRSSELQLDSTVTFFGYETASDSTPLFKNVYNYPQENIQVITEYFHDFDHWTPLARTTLVEDELGRLVDAFAQQYDDVTGEFIPDSRIVSFPHGNTEQMDSFFVLAWNPEIKDYVRQLAVWNQFDSQDRLDESRSSIEIFELPIEFIDRYKYNPEGDLIRIESYLVDSGEEILAGVVENWYTDHLLTTSITLVSDGPNGLLSESKVEYEYTDFRKESLVQVFAHDPEKNDWMLIHVTGFIYDTQERMVGKEENAIDDSGLWTRNKDTYEYVQDEYISIESGYYYDSNLEVWVLEDKKYYYYDGLSAVDPEDPIIADATFLWPNPTAGEVQVKLPGKVSVHVYTISGQFVKKYYLPPGDKMLDLSSLPAGIYQVMAKSDEEYFSGKLLIQ